MVEVRYLVEGRHGAAVVGGNAAAGVADEKGELEAAEGVEGDDGGVLGFFRSGEGWGDLGGFAVRREEIVGYVFDEDLFLSLWVACKLSAVGHRRLGAGDGTEKWS